MGVADEGLIGAVAAADDAVATTAEEIGKMLAVSLREVQKDAFEVAYYWPTLILLATDATVVVWRFL